MGLIALASSLAVLVAVFRVLQDLVRYASICLRIGFPTQVEIQIAGISGPVYRIEHPFPVVGVIGIFSPQYLSRAMFSMH